MSRKDCIGRMSYESAEFIVDNEEFCELYSAIVKKIKRNKKCIELYNTRLVYTMIESDTKDYDNLGYSLVYNLYNIACSYRSHENIERIMYLMFCRLLNDENAHFLFGEFEKSLQHLIQDKKRYEFIETILNASETIAPLIKKEYLRSFLACWLKLYNDIDYCRVSLDFYSSMKHDIFLGCLQQNIPLFFTHYDYNIIKYYNSVDSSNYKVSDELALFVLKFPICAEMRCKLQVKSSYILLVTDKAKKTSMFLSDKSGRKICCKPLLGPVKITFEEILLNSNIFLV